MKGLVRTVLGDVLPENLGVTYMHEHLIIDSPLVADTMPHIHLPDADAAVEELFHCREAGVGAVVDAMPAGSGRCIERLAAVSERSGLHIIATTGLHTKKYYQQVDWANTEDPHELAERFIADLEVGIDRYDYLGPDVERTTHRAGIVKAATSNDSDSERDQRIFEAAAIASHTTGAPMLTHCEEGRGATDQLDLLRASDMAMDRVVMSHTDKIDDRGYHRDLLDSGVNLVYDQALRHGATSNSPTAQLLAAMIDEGYLAQLMVGTDGARRTLWSSLGGQPGLSWLASGFRSAMARSGIDEAQQQVLFVENPQRLLAFSQPADSVVV